MEEQFIKDLNNNNQRMDTLIASVRALMKSDSKTKRVGVSPSRCTTAKRGIQKDKSNKKLIQRV